MDTGRVADASRQDGFRELAAALVDTSEHIKRAAQEATGYRPLPNGMFDILRVIEANPGITVAQVASRLDRQFSNVSTQLKNLADRGLVTRNRDSSDKRYVTLHATAGAERIKNVIETSWADALATASLPLSSEERNRLRELGPTLALLASHLTRA
ncbi:MarR family winged helix-turn-helix transcriptional regulator [Arthrobacter rhombi]|uniref:MarR family winged helix-turn-helix transcriptional regulator n=1 Tax=Arthrobacter rhombi TaxID=71253 RepID=UPI0031CDDC46